MPEIRPTLAFRATDDQILPGLKGIAPIIVGILSKKRSAVLPQHSKPIGLSHIGMKDGCRFSLT